MGIQEVSDIIGSIAYGFEESCAKCIADNSAVIVESVKEQLYSGLDGEDKALSPTYDDDPFFNEEGYWYNRAADYKAWKSTITPPRKGSMLGLDPRREDVPNLFIDGTFYNEITARRSGTTLLLDPGSGNGPDIVDKYGEQILAIGKTARGFFIENYLLPSIKEYFKKCGYR